MKRGFHILAGFLIPFLILFCILPEAKAEEPWSCQMYYLDSSEGRLMTREYRTEEIDSDQLLGELISSLNRREAAGSYHALLAEGVTIQSYSLQEGNLILNFNSAYREAGLGRELLSRNGLVKLFSQLPEVESVEIYVENSPLTDSKNNRIGALTPESFVELNSEGTNTYRYETFTLYFTDKDGTSLVPEIRTVYYRRTIPKGRVALEQLIKGPIERGHYPCLLDRTIVNSVMFSDEVCYVDLNSSFLDHSLGLSDSIVLGAVANTLIANTDAQKVEILINGKENVDFSENTNLYNFYLWNEELIQEESIE